MRKFKTVFMRGGTSKGCLFKKEDLPEDRALWDQIFLQTMGWIFLVSESWRRPSSMSRTRSFWYAQRISA